MLPQMDCAKVTVTNGRPPAAVLFNARIRLSSREMNTAAASWAVDLAKHLAKATANNAHVPSVVV